MKYQLKYAKSKPYHSYPVNFSHVLNVKDTSGNPLLILLLPEGVPFVSTVLSSTTGLTINHQAQKAYYEGFQPVDTITSADYPYTVSNDGVGVMTMDIPFQLMKNDIVYDTIIIPPAETDFYYEVKENFIPLKQMEAEALETDGVISMLKVQQYNDELLSCDVDLSLFIKQPELRYFISEGTEESYLFYYVVIS